MKNIFSIMLIMLALFLGFPADAGKVDGRGRQWLDEHKDSPQVNVTGTWESADWGKTLNLTQAEGSRDVSGTDTKFGLVRRNRGWTPALVACQVSDRVRVQGRGRCGSRTIFSW
jgi:hypothetical protein